MKNSNDRPSTETDATPRPAKGQNVKALVTPGDDAEREAEDEEDAPPSGADPKGADDGSTSGDLPATAPASITGLAG